MRRVTALIALFILVILFTVWDFTPRSAAGLTGAAATNQEENDPDVPRFTQGKIDKETYLGLREEYINLLRGVLPGQLFDFKARGRAIHQMEEQKARIAKIASDAQKTLSTTSVTSTTSVSTPANSRLAGASLPANSAQTQAAVASTAPAWTPIGPAPIPNGQVAIVTGATPVTGRVTALAIDPTNSMMVYLGTAQGGVWRSTNGGVNWTPIFDSAQSLAIGALALAPSNPHILYVGTGEASFSADSFSGVGLYRIDSVDSSPSLVGPIDPPTSTPIAGANSFGGRTISKILVHPTNPDIVFVATGSGIIGIGADPAKGGTVPPLPPRGIYRSTNASAAPGSVTFTKLAVTTENSVLPDTTGNDSITDMVFEPGNPSNLTCWVRGSTAARGGGIYRSTNALDPTPNFTQTFATTVPNARASLAINKIGSTVTAYAATGESATGTGCTSGGSGVIRKSTDGGATWSGKLMGGGGFCGGQCFYDITIAVDPSNANLAYLGGSADPIGVGCSHQFQKTADGFATTAGTVSSDQGLHADTHITVLDPNTPTTIYFGSDGGVWKSLDAGNSWALDLNANDLSATQFQSIDVHPVLRDFTIGGTQDNGTNCRRANGTWVRCDFGDGGYAQIDKNATNEADPTMYHTYFNFPNFLVAFAEEDPLSLAAPVDAGWNLFGCGDGSTPSNGINCTDNVLFYAPMALGPGNPNTHYYGTDRLYRSPDRGNTNTIVSQSPIVPNGTRCPSGQTCPPDTPATVGVQITSIGISPQNDNVRMVGLRNGKVFATSTGSSALTDVSSADFPAVFVSRAVIDPNDQNTAYVTFTGFLSNSTVFPNAASHHHIWKTNNLNAGAGATWTPIDSGIPDVPVNAFAVDPSAVNFLGNLVHPLFAGTDIGVYVSFDNGVSWNPYGTGLPAVAVFDMAIQNGFQVLRIATHGRGMWEIPISPCSTTVNVALAANGGTATASSTYPFYNFSPSGAIDGDRTGNNWGNGGGWNDGTFNTWPDSLAIDLNGSRTISEIRVYTLQNNWQTAGEPNLTTPATGEGILDFDVQYWTGSAWALVPNCNGSAMGCSVTTNDRAMRVFTLSTPITTTKIQIVVNNGRNGYSRIVEVEALACGS